jgi:glyoxylate reductase
MTTPYRTSKTGLFRGRFFYAQWVESSGKKASRNRERHGIYYGVVSMAKVYVSRIIPGDVVNMIQSAGHEVIANHEDRPSTREELLERIPGCEGLLAQLLDTIDEEFYEAAGDGLKVVSNFAVGYNNVDVDLATSHGVVVCNTPGVLTDATADLAWALVMGITRRVAEGDRLVRNGEWVGWKPTQLLGSDLVGKTLAIVGAGRIGYGVAKRAKGWDMEILYVARSEHSDFENDLGARRVELEEALATADIVSVHVPLTDQTHHLLGADQLKLMKSDAYLINTSRGPVVDEAALVDLLKSEAIAGAGLDVYEEEPKVHPGLLECDNALLLPHLGSATRQTRAAMGRLAAQNLLDVIEGRAPQHAVNVDLVAKLGLSD